ncbi:protein kinase domain-containing protein [Rubripirellula reticaptiva]|uniref:Serine/threonine-protein kinase PknD n=1 Tax=Rubripirellula reticaptiva TaxID=2528013 RepID=A0A5C6F7K9_9BACT|nr:protein kinase [Rubripirellula reticaptiva]TWU57703.1 Serine/threonine-protein kinase PknD [Rubripirellula reticaptiva]
MSDPDPENAARVESIFFDALDLPATERDAFIDRQCAGDENLRSKVNDLLAADEAAAGEDFLKSAFIAKQVVDDYGSPEPHHAVTDHFDPDSPSNDDGETGRFRILSRHQQGGLGEVLIALDQQLGRQVAIKQIKPQWKNHREARERFVQEAEVTGRLEHPGIVPVYAMGTWPDGRRFYAMRFIQGDTLKQAIVDYHDSNPHETPSVRQLGLRQLLGKFVDVCNTISYAHSRKILHRDIKPANIMVGPYGETLVVDWGLAKLLDAPQSESMTQAIIDEIRQNSDSTPTRFGGTVGTPQYMSPEQADGRIDEISTRTDIYLLGATLYEILAGLPPHRDDSLKRLLPRIIAGEFPPPRDIVADVPPALQAVCLKAMSREPRGRYGSVSEMATDIERWLADEPVSVHRDSRPVLIGRWVRRHRTLAYSAAVAATLVTVGSISGSAIWNTLKAKQFRIERENNANALALDVVSARRLIELRTSAEGAIDLAEKEIAANRYSSALGVLNRAIDSLDEEPELRDIQDETAEKAIQLSRIVDFYQYADETSLYNVLARDSRSIAACRASLESLGVWDHPDWWFRLPASDLSPEQADRLRWDVYQQWMLLDAMLIKTAGTRLTGIGRITSNGGLFGATRRFLRTSEGKSECRSAEIVSRRIEMFRRSEAAHWYRRAAEFRLMKGSRLAASELGLPQTATDSHGLGVLSMIAAMDPNFELFFRNYQGDDSLVTSRDLFLRASTQRPNHYWTSLALAQVEFLMAERDGGDDPRQYDAAIQAIGRCIAIEPQKCFAFADRSSMYRAQARLIERLPAADSQFDAADRKRRAAELRRWSLADATEADRLSRNQLEGEQPWVGWQHGLAIYDFDSDDAARVDRAIDRFTETSKLTLALVPIVDASLVRADDLRGRDEAAEVVKAMADRSAKDPKFPALLASIRLGQDRFDEAKLAAEEAIRRSPDSALAHAVAGLLELQDERPSAAQIGRATAHLNAAKRIDANHDWIDWGLGRCFEHRDRLAEAMTAYREAFAKARTTDHRAAAMLGQARIFGATTRYKESREAIQRARILEPATDLMLTVIRPLGLRYGSMQKVAPENEKLPAMKTFLESLVTIPRISDFEVPVADEGPFRAAVLNGGFELGSTRYWTDDADARVIRDDSHDGEQCLMIPAATRGSVIQVFPVQPASNYRIEIWAKTVDDRPATCRVWLDASQVIEFRPAADQWTAAEGTFQTTDQTWPPVTDTTLRIEVSGEGRIKLDDVQVWWSPK